MQGEEATDERGGCWPGGSGSPVRGTSSEDGIRGCSTVIDSPVKSGTTCMSAPSTLQGGKTSSDGKTRRYVRTSAPRLKWTDELHYCFMRAIEILGGPQKATPKAILQVMNIRGLKIAHIKSHLQMFRNPKSGKRHGSQSDFQKPNSQMQVSSQQVDTEAEASWRSVERGATIFETSTVREHYADRSATAESAFAQFNQMGRCSTIAGSLSPTKRESLSIRPESISKDFSYPNYFNQLESSCFADSGLRLC